MTLRLYDTATRAVRDFEPREPGKVGVYLCGLTVQSGPHIGHLRSGVNYDVLRRWLLQAGYACPSAISVAISSCISGMCPVARGSYVGGSTPSAR